MTGRPVYLQIADDLRSKISDGTYPVGSALPSTNKLMEQYGGSVTVVRAAIRELRSEGILIGQPGKGVYVQNLAEVNAGDTPDLADRLDQLTETVRHLAERVATLEQDRHPDSGR